MKNQIITVLKILGGLRIRRNTGLVFLVLFSLFGGIVAWTDINNPSVVATIQGEGMSLPNGVNIVSNNSASGGEFVHSAKSGTLSSTFNLTSPADTIHVYVQNSSTPGAYTGSCRNKYTTINIEVDGVTVLTGAPIIYRNWKDVSANITLPVGSHTVSAVYDNSASITQGCDRFYLTSIDMINIVKEQATAPTSSVGAIGSLSMVRPVEHPATGSSASLKGAAGSFESFQVVVDSNPSNQAVPNVDMVTSGTALSDGLGHTIPASKLTIYREGYTTISLPSDGELFATNPCTSNCRVPDALIPKTDYIYNEPRNAFPVTVPAGENRVAWVDVQIPAGQTPGVYTGLSIKVTSNGAEIATIPITLRVINFNMPATSSLGGAFGISTGRICLNSGIYANCTVGSGIPANLSGGAWQVYADYARAALENRVSLSRPSYLGLGSNLANFRTYAEPLLDGTATRTAGQKITDIFLNGAEGPNAGAWKTEGSTHSPSFLQKISYYCDEFSDAQWQSVCGSAYDVANTSWQGTGASIGPIPNAVVTPTLAHLTSGISQNVTAALNTKTLIPVANYVDPYNSGSTRSTYDTFSNTSGNRLWMYTSCMSVGCGTAYTPDPDWVGWPVLSGIDQPPSEERAMGWQDFNYKVSGDYYFESLQNIAACTNWNTGTPPVNCMFNEGGNGDGTLFYPGYTSQVGGTHDIPIETIRLKRYRDGRQDYELLNYLSHQCNGACPSITETQVRNISGGPYGSSSGLFPTLSQSNVTQSVFDSMRDQLNSLLP